MSRLESSGREINFRAVAAEARVSTAWLYNQGELRVRIMRSRKSQAHVSAVESGKAHSEDLSQESIIATLRLRVKRLERENRELKERLEHANGLVAAISLSAPSAGWRVTR